MSARRVACLASVIVSAMVPITAAAASARLDPQASAAWVSGRSVLVGDPYAGARGSHGQHRTEVEPSVAAHGNTAVAAFQVGRNSRGGSDNIGFGRSTDGGRTWHGGFLPGITKVTGGPWDAVSDPSVVYDAKHRTWMIASVEGTTTLPKALSVSRSTNGAVHWSPPVYLGTDSSIPDKEWLACDNNAATSPDFGNCYVTWEGGIDDQVYMQRSTDGGKTWQARYAVPGAIGSGGEPVVQPHGRVVVPFMSTHAIEAFTSRDGGKTWAPPVNVASLHTANVHLRTLPGPSVAIGPGGHVYVVWAGCEGHVTCPTDRLLMSTALDGRHWSEPVHLPTGSPTGADSLIPALAAGTGRSDADRDTRLAITYYRDSKPGCASPCSLTPETIVADDGGGHWSAPRALGPSFRTSWLAKTTQGPMVGDYLGEAITANGNAVSVFATAKPPTGGTLHEHIVADSIHIN